MEMMEVQVPQHAGLAAQGVDERVGNAGDAGKVDVIPVPDALHGLIG